MNARSLIVFVALFICISVVYVVYGIYNNQSYLYVTLSVLKPKDMPTDDIPFWYSTGIEIGDRDINPFGATDAVIVDKQSYPAKNIGFSVYVVARVRATRDQTGKLRFKNQPIAVGQTMQLALTRVSALRGVIMTMDTKPPTYAYQKVTVSAAGKNVDQWIIESLKEGSVIRDGKGNNIARLLKKTPTQRDVTVLVELFAKSVGESAVYLDAHKVKVDEFIWLPFQEVNFYPRITAIVKIEPLDEKASL